jgi:hypothetical protein
MKMEEEEEEEERCQGKFYISLSLCLSFFLSWI